jgi:hypothetical protein
MAELRVGLIPQSNTSVHYTTETALVPEEPWMMDLLTMGVIVS